MNYPIEPTVTFHDSLQKIVNTWRNIYYLPESQISGYINLIYKRIQQLNGMPHLGHPVNNLPGYPLIKLPTRKLVINRAYSVFYRIIKQKVYLGRIFSNRQNPKHLDY